MHGTKLAIIILYPTSTRGIIVLLKIPTKYHEFFPTLYEKQPTYSWFYFWADMYSTIFWKAWYVATVISCTFNPLIFYPKSLFSRTLTQSLDFTRKFFVMQATAHTKVPRTIVTKRLSFLFLQLVDASFCQFWLQEAKKQVFLILVIFKDITKLNMFATFLYLSKHFVILSLKTDFATDCIVNSRF